MTDSQDKGVERGSEPLVECMGKAVPSAVACTEGNTLLSFGQGAACCRGESWPCKGLFQSPWFSPCIAVSLVPGLTAGISAAFSLVNP